jgi:glycogen(starch) synthase
MTEPLRVSVVINTYNRCLSLGTTLAALHRQNYPHFEIIVVNGPSTDGTARLLESYRDSLRVGRCAQRNLSISRNVGIAMAAGELVAFIDDDAVPDEDWLVEAVAAFDCDEVAGVGGFVYDHTGYRLQYRYSLADRLGRGIFNVAEPVGESFCYPGCVIYPYLQGTNAVFRRRALLEVGGFDEEYDYYLDETDLCLRLIDAGFLLRQLSNSFVYHRFLPSHIRQSNRVVTQLRPIIKNKVYFALKNSLEGTSYRVLLDEWKRSTDESEAGICYHVQRGDAAPGVLEQFHRDADLALREGLERGLHRPRRLMDSAIAAEMRGEIATDVLEPDRKGQFTPCPILLPAAEKLTVCYLSQQYPPGLVGGIGRLSYDLACGLAAGGHQVHVLARSSTGFNTVDFEQGVWVHRLALDQQEPPAPEGVIVPHEAWQCSARLLRELRRIDAVHPIDIVEGPIWDVEGLAAVLDGRFCVLTNLETPMKMVVETNPELVDRSAPGQKRYEEYYAAETLLMQRSTALRAISHAIVGTMHQCYGIDFPPEQVSVFPLGMEDRSIGHSTQKKGNFVDVLFAGRFEGRKGIDVLLQVIPPLCLKYPEARFILVGEDRPRPSGNSLGAEFRAQHARASFRDRVLFPGAVSDQELEQYLAQCDIFVSPSRYESFGLVFLEAMMFAKPAVGCRVGGMQEVIVDGATGLLAEPGDAPSLEAAVDTLLADRERREAFGKAGRQRYLNHYTREIFAQRTLAFYRQVLAKKICPETGRPGLARLAESGPQAPRQQATPA